METLHTEPLDAVSLGAALAAFRASSGRAATVLTAATINDSDLRNAAELLAGDRNLTVRGSVNLPTDTWRLE